MESIAEMIKSEVREEVKRVFNIPLLKKVEEPSQNELRELLKSSKAVLVKGCFDCKSYLETIENLKAELDEARLKLASSDCAKILQDKTISKLYVELAETRETIRKLKAAGREYLGPELR
ncbi:MAG: hypothetical protein KAJ07_00335 [Planctomycetes bacterium]|nr:hypothetical protein [Planctomycetota bacterium]